MKHGKFQGWEDGYKQLEGYFDNGKQQGEWSWYDRDGNVIKSIVYEDGEKQQ